MNTLEAQVPPRTQTFARLRETAPRPPRAAAPAPAHDLLRLMPEPALATELALRPERPVAPFIPGPEAARTYWFDL